MVAALAGTDLIDWDVFAVGSINTYGVCSVAPPLPCYNLGGSVFFLLKKIIRYKMKRQFIKR